MALYLRFVLGNRKQYLSDTMSDIVLYHILHEKHCDKHTDTRIYKVQEIIQFAVKPRCQTAMNIQYRKLQRNSSKSAGNSYKQGKNNHDIPLRQSVKEMPEWCQNIFDHEF